MGIARCRRCVVRSASMISLPTYRSRHKNQLSLPPARWSTRRARRAIRAPKGRRPEEAYMIKYDLLVYLGLLPLVAVIIFSGFVIWRTPTDTDLETRKIRMADAVLVGLLALFIFAAILYFVDPEGAGEQIFNKAFPVIFALVGTIVGYIFGIARKQ